jgi:hypothetical protein
MSITILRIQKLTSKNNNSSSKKRKIKISRYTTLFIQPFQEDDQ